MVFDVRYEVMPQYLDLLHSGELHKRSEALSEKLRECTLCPRECKVDRTKDEHGFCRSGLLPIVASYFVHHGEEPVISGTSGSGTICLLNLLVTLQITGLRVRIATVQKLRGHLHILPLQLAARAVT